MGLFGSLFGKKEPEATDRCMECGMTEGRHTEWCPSVQEEEAVDTHAGEAEEPDEAAVPREGPGTRDSAG